MHCDVHHEPYAVARAARAGAIRSAAPGRPAKRRNSSDLRCSRRAFGDPFDHDESRFGRRARAPAALARDCAGRPARAPARGTHITLPNNLQYPKSVLYYHILLSRPYWIPLIIAMNFMDSVGAQRGRRKRSCSRRARTARSERLGDTQGRRSTAHSPAAARLNLKSDLSASQPGLAPSRSLPLPLLRLSVRPVCVWPGSSRSWRWSWRPSVGRPSAWARAPCWCWCCGWCSCLASFAARVCFDPRFAYSTEVKFKIVRLARRIYARLKIVPARAAWPGRPV